VTDYIAFDLERKPSAFQDQFEIRGAHQTARNQALLPPVLGRDWRPCGSRRRLAGYPLTGVADGQLADILGTWLADEFARDANSPRPALATVLCGIRAFEPVREAQFPGLLLTPCLPGGRTADLSGAPLTG